MGWLFDDKPEPQRVTLRNRTTLKCVACAGEIFSNEAYGLGQTVFQPKPTCWVCTVCGVMHWVLGK